MKDFDQRIKELKLSGRLLVQQFADIFQMEASVLEEKVIDASNLEKDIKLEHKMTVQLFNDLKNSNLSKNDKNARVESVLTYSVKYLEDCEKILDLAKHREFDKDTRFETNFKDLLDYIQNLKSTIVDLESFLQSNS